jgi:hypothetical protein
VPLLLAARDAHLVADEAAAKFDWFESGWSAATAALIPVARRDRSFPVI